MDIKEKAKAYAEGKAQDAITTAIEEAYAAGYKDGYNEGLSSRDNLSPNEIVEGVEYVDLGLPSGTKWANDFLRDENGKIKLFHYDEARNYNVPNPMQFREFLEYTSRSLYEECFTGKRSTRILGANGYEFFWGKLQSTIANISPSKFDFMFWLKDMVEKGSERNAVQDSKIVNIFKGHKLPIILVR